jgi:integrase/recombinase XerD
MAFDSYTEEFLGALKLSTRRIYRAGLTAFRSFYGPRGTIRDFMDQVAEDEKRTLLEKTRIARNILSEFVEWLEAQGYKPKTVKAYVAAVQSEARYFDLNISTRYVNIPPSQPVSRKHPWTLEDVARFVGMMRKPEYRSLAATMFQSGLGVSDVLALTYGDIQHEYELGITPLCLDLTRIKTNTPHVTFVGSWGTALLREHLTDAKPRPSDPLYSKSLRNVDRQFERLGKNFIEPYQGSNPCRPHSLRAAFRTLLADHRVEPLYIEFWMGHRVPEQQRVYVSKSREGWRQTYREQAEPWLTPDLEEVK